MTVVVRDGKLVRVADGAKSWPLAGSRAREVGPRTSTELVGLDVIASYAAIYAGQPMVYALVNKLARGISRLPLRTYEWLDEDANEKTERPTSDLARMIKRPFERGSRRKLVEALIGSVAVYGHGYGWKYRPQVAAPPTEVWPMDARYVRYRIGPDAPIAHYEYNDGYIRKRILPEDMLHLTWWSPRGERGTSPLEPLRQMLALEDAASRYALANFANAARPSGALVHPKALDDEDRKELQAEIDSVHSGPDNAFRMILLDGGLDWKAFSHTAEESQTIEMRKLNQVEACVVYDIPPPVVHILDKATFANITEQNVALYRESLSPWFTMFETDFVAQVVDVEAVWRDKFFVEFDLREVLRALIGERADAYVKLLSIYTPNELRAMENLPPIDHKAADCILFPLNYQPVGPGFDLAEPPSTETRQLAALLVDALRDGNGQVEKARDLLDRLVLESA